MAPFAPTYFLCPHFDYPPSSIELGHIISSPSDPSNALNLDDVVKPGIDEEVHVTSVSAFTVSRSQLDDQKSGILVKFLQVFGFGSHFEYGEGTEDVFKCDLLETKFFQPSSEYLEEAIQAEGVQMFLAGSRFKKPLYIITGVKIVKGGRSSRTTTSTGIARLDVASLTGEHGVPITVEPGVEVASSWSESKSFQKKSDFVFAFRLSKLNVKPLERSSKLRLGLIRRVSVGLEDAGIGGVRDVVADEIIDDIIDDNKEHSPAIVLYSAENYAKGAVLF